MIVWLLVMWGPHHAIPIIEPAPFVSERECQRALAIIRRARETPGYCFAAKVAARSD